MPSNRGEYQRKYYKEHRNDLLLRARWWKETHPFYQAKRTQALKHEVLTHYGDGKLACIVCGETRLPCLSLDHINNDGYAERKKLFKRQQGGGGVQFYLKVKKAGFPIGYQTLCMNCQWIKRFAVKPDANY